MRRVFEMDPGAAKRTFDDENGRSKSKLFDGFSYSHSNLYL